jgi:hypothetical protein
MKSLTLLWNTIAHELAVGCCTSAHRDIETVAERSKNEGLSFLTITLPSFAKDFERCLELGKMDDSLFSSFINRGVSRHFCRVSLVSSLIVILVSYWKTPMSMRSMLLGS